MEWRFRHGQLPLVHHSSQPVAARPPSYAPAVCPLDRETVPTPEQRRTARARDSLSHQRAGRLHSGPQAQHSLGGPCLIRSAYACMRPCQRRCWAYACAGRPHARNDQARRHPAHGKWRASFQNRLARCGRHPIRPPWLRRTSHSRIAESAAHRPLPLHGLYGAAKRWECACRRLRPPIPGQTRRNPGRSLVEHAARATRLPRSTQFPHPREHQSRMAGRPP
eukprot:scaffold38321_cov35-Tisochrysis_lutea.AAC.2